MATPAHENASAIQDAQRMASESTDAIVAESKLAGRCVEFDMRVAFTNSIISALCKLRARWVEAIASGNIAPDAACEETIREGFRGLAKLMARAIERIEFFESEGYAVNEAADFRLRHHEIKKFLVDPCHSEGIEEVLGAMMRGVPLDRSAEYLRSCGEVAEQIGRADKESFDMQAWAERLARESSHFGD